MPKKTFNQRVLEAKAIAKLGKVTSEDSGRRAKTTTVPGSNAVQYHGIIRRGSGIITTECRKIIGVGHKDCLGNYRSICRHSMASIMLATAHNGFVPRFRSSKENAVKLAERFQESVFCDKFGDPVIFQIHSHNLDNRIKVRKVGNGYVSWIGKEPIFHKLTFTSIKDAIDYWKDRYSIYMIILEEDLV